MLDVSAVTDMSELFKNGRPLHDIGTLDSISFDGDISLWDTSAGTNMVSMLEGCIAFDRDISIWYVNNVSDFTDNIHYREI